MKAWKLLETSPLTTRLPWFQIFQERVELPSGRILDDFYRIVMPDFAMVVPVTSSGKLLMVRGYKHGPRKVCLSTPGGMVEPGESPLEAAQRELLEETGYEAAEWKSLGSFVTDSNREGGTAHLFLARNAVEVGTRREDEAEELQLELMSPELFLEAIQTNDIATLATVSAVALALVSGI